MKKLITIAFLGFGLTAFAQDSTNTFDYNYRKGLEHRDKGIKSWGVEKKPSVSAIEEFKLATPFFEKAYPENPRKVYEVLIQAYAISGEKEKMKNLKKDFSKRTKK